MRSRGKAPTTATFIICVILYLIALAGQFGIFNMSGGIAGVSFADWAWIIGFALLLIAIRVRGL